VGKTYCSESGRRVETTKAFRVWLNSRGLLHCRSCGEPDPAKLHSHHIHTTAEGGPDEFDNLVCLCVDCHGLAHAVCRGRSTAGLRWADLGRMIERRRVRLSCESRLARAKEDTRGVMESHLLNRGWRAAELFPGSSKYYQAEMPDGRVVVTTLKAAWKIQGELDLRWTGGSPDAPAS
jgi:hypothetical protein